MRDYGQLKKSHPSWVRGLKPGTEGTLERYRVAPLVGAWIETLSLFLFVAACHVAPLVGAWIETTKAIESLLYILSHPSWVRGLKL